MLLLFVNIVSNTNTLILPVANILLLSFMKLPFISNDEDAITIGNVTDQINKTSDQQALFNMLMQAPVAIVVLAAHTISLNWLTTCICL